MPPVATITNASPARIADRPNASRIKGAAGRCITTEAPRSPCSMPLNQCQYCSGNGSFRPSFASNARTLSGVANSPRIAYATLPGRICTTAKISTDMRKHAHRASRPADAAGTRPAATCPSAQSGGAKVEPAHRMGLHAGDTPCGRRRRSSDVGEEPEGDWRPAPPACRCSSSSGAHGSPLSARGVERLVDSGVAIVPEPFVPAWPLCEERERCWYRWSAARRSHRYRAAPCRRPRR